LFTVLAGIVHTHRSPKPIQVVEQEPWHFEAEGAEVILQVTPQDAGDHAIVRFTPVDRFGFQEQQQTRSRIEIGIVQTANLVNQIVAERQCAERPSWTWLGKASLGDNLPDAMSGKRVPVFRPPVDQHRPIEVAANCPFGTSQRTEDHNAFILGIGAFEAFGQFLKLGRRFSLRLFDCRP
jgi:hypothetical protein